MTIEVVLLGTGNPLPDRDRAGAATLVRAGGLDAARRRGPRGLHAPGGRGRVAVHARRGAAHPPAQRSHLRSERRGHHAVGDEPGAEDLAGVRPAAHERSRWPACGRCSSPTSSTGSRITTTSRGSPSTEVVEVEPGVDPRRERRARRRRRYRSPARPSRRSGSASSTTGKAVVLAGDTVPCAGLDELCRDADIYVQTVLRDDLVNLVPMQRFRDTIDYHSTVVQAAQTAARGGVAHARVDPPDPHPRSRRPPTSGSTSRVSTSPARSCSAKTC